ncbi:hypothetical protein ACIAIL_31300, partial [Raoultella ornithinolytica]
LPISSVFLEARKNADATMEMEECERQTLGYIIEAEPFLSLIDLMFTGLRRQSQQSLDDFALFWQRNGLTTQSLPQLSMR